MQSTFPHPASPLAARNAMRPLSNLVFASALALGAFVGMAPGAQAAEPASDWSYELESIASGINDGFQVALDPVAGRVYFSDAEWRSEGRDSEGNTHVLRTASGKLVVFDSADRSLLGVHSFLDLSRTDGSGTERAALDWSGVTDPEQDSNASMRATFSPYGIAIDGATTGADGQPDATIVTTTARGRDPEFGYGGHMVIYRASQGAPTDADRLWQFEDGSPVFEGMRRVVVNTRTHKAYVTNMGEYREEGGGRPGFISVIDLETRTPEARIPVPEGVGVIGVAVDEVNNLVYVGPLSGEKLHVIDAAAIDTSAPQDFDLNRGTIRELPAEVGSNARPEFDAATKRIYVASFNDPKGRISIVDGDPASDTYGTVLTSAEAGQTNALTPDPKRGILLSANLGDQEVVVHDIASLDVLLRVKTTGKALNAVVDPETGNVWVSSAENAGKIDVITLKAPK